MLKAVLFDMDGVIVDTEPLHYKAYYAMFKDFNLEVTDEMYQAFTGKSTINICKNLCAYFNLEADPKELVERKRFHFKDLFFNDPSLTLISGVLDLIKDYYNNGLTLVLASSASMTTINNVFTKFDLDQYFVAKLSGADLKASKPHPEIFINAAEASGFDRSECIVIEDSTNGIKAAYDAGIYCIGYDSFHSKNQDYSLANKVVSDFKEIHYNKIQHLFL
ncbi:HAD superfamily hydrolase (TIGR01509 family) [Oceanihabitans sediminis]|uniref:HAD family phosphatase n=1 Tax=Oceanihabitans sediminis TaxID=1812012 RepID=A0A368P6L0_9FLAO|nr:HAD family phosphatase [Oceanihabitans sediminis]MDX1773510.1 HAD family phosphatase [Oceanihabitans sediminis]RBP32956.1 HAD superfamily hydrolase (TIGR01509 family) [Oceanihabitans sediminis]RCU57525.1 HAD family phosphatase [Oceanihabitans sediminis]